MGRITTPVSLILCLLLGTLPGRSLSQTQEPQSGAESQWQRMRQLQQEHQQRMQEQRQRMIQQQEESWQRVDGEERQRLQESLPGLTDAERQRRQESLRQKEEQHRQMVQRQRESFERQGGQEKQHQQRMEEQRLKDKEEMATIGKVADEYSEETWQDALAVTPEQWKALKPRLETIRKLKEPAEIDISIYWVAGSGGYQAESVSQAPDGTRSTVRSSGQFSATTGVRTTSDSTIRSGADGGTRDGGHGEASGGGSIKSGQFSATTGLSTVPPDSGPSRVDMRTFGEGGSGASRVGGVIRLYVQTPGPVKKQVGDINLGWQWRRPWLDKSPAPLSESERACERLVDALEMKDPDPEQVRRQMEALRQVRAQRQAQLREAQRQLCEVITPEQEPKLVLMGYLD
jgi:hypothetical protein